MAWVEIYTEAGMPTGRASGAYAAGLMARQALLPVEEEGHLNDPPLCENSANGCLPMPAGRP